MTKVFKFWYFADRAS